MMALFIYTLHLLFHLILAVTVPTVIDGGGHHHGGHAGNHRYNRDDDGGGSQRRYTNECSINGASCHQCLNNNIDFENDSQNRKPVCVFLSCERRSFCIEANSPLVRYFFHDNSMAERQGFDENNRNNVAVQPCRVWRKCSKVERSSTATRSKESFFSSSAARWSPIRNVSDSGGNSPPAPNHRHFFASSPGENASRRRRFREPSSPMRQISFRYGLAVPSTGYSRFPGKPYSTHHREGGAINLGTVLAITLCSSMVLAAVITVAYKRIKRIYVGRNPYGSLREENPANSGTATGSS